MRSVRTVFHAISDPTRRAILDRLLAGEESVLNLAKSFDMSLPAVSQHLKVLQEAGVVRRRREGRYLFYRIHPEPLTDIARWIHPYELFWRDRLQALDAHLRRKHGPDHR